MRWQDGLDTEIARPQEMAILCLEATVRVWHQNAASVAEPVAHAFQRIFRQSMPAMPFLMAVVYHGGRFLTVHAYPGGFIAVRDPSRGGWELRTFTAADRAGLTRLHNVCRDLETKSGYRGDVRLGSAGLAWAKSAIASRAA